MAFTGWLTKNTDDLLATATTATVATPKPFSKTTVKEKTQTVATVATVAVARWSYKKLTPKERASMLNYAEAIGETNPEEITYVLNQCETDPVARKWFLERAAKVSLFRKPHAEMQRIINAKHDDRGKHE